LPHHAALAPRVLLDVADIGDALGPTVSSSSASAAGGSDGDGSGSGAGGGRSTPDDAPAARTVVLTRAATAALLARAPGAAARRAAHEAGLVPRLAAGGAALSRLALCRDGMAQLCGAGSFPELCCARLAAPGPVEVAGFLQEAAEKLRPLAERQVGRLLARAQRLPDEVAPGASASGLAVAERKGGGTAAAVRQEDPVPARVPALAPPFEPWDWERLFEAVRRQYGG
jgi:hypothetical protein